MYKMKTSIYFKITLLGILFTACAKDGFSGSADARLLTGLWHGLILPFSVMGKILGLNIGIHDAICDRYEYWIGFLIGILVYMKALDLLPKKDIDK